MNRHGTYARRRAVAATVAGVAMLGVSAFSLHRYGEPEAPVVRTVPGPTVTVTRPLTIGVYGPDADANSRGGTFAAIPHCEQEDGGSSEPCLWDATVDGNGTGDSYLIYPGPDGEPRFLYLTHTEG
jgi:hypothetical protein